jgi:hypothetical protein
MSHSEPDDLVGMNPDKMRALIDELRSAHHAITAFAGEFSAPLSSHGISMSTVHHAERWTADQVSMLTGRLEKLTDEEQHDGKHTVPPMQPVHTAPAAHGHGSGTGGTAPGPGPVTGTGTGAGAGSGAGAGAAGYSSAGAATVGVPGAYGPVAVPSSHAAAHHPHAAAVKHATLAAKHVSHAAQHNEGLPESIWEDLTRNASDPQYAAAFLAAIGAAGLAVLGAAIASSRKKSKDKKEGDRKQAVLDELLRNAGQSDVATVPPGSGEAAGREEPAEPESAVPGTAASDAAGQADQVPEPAGGSEHGEPAAPVLRLVRPGR